jgi:hypothetical protein
MRRSTYRVFAMGLIVTGIALSAACSSTPAATNGSDAAPPSTASNAPVDPTARAACALLTPAEAAKAMNLAEAPQRSENTDDACSYDASARYGGTVTFNLLDATAVGPFASLRAQAKASVKTGDVWKDEPAYGPDAYSIETVVGSTVRVSFFVLKSGKVIVLSGVRSGGEGDRAATKAGTESALKLVLSRM